MTDLQTSQASAANGGPPGFSLSNLAGRYAFRFDGFTVTNNILYNLRGLGQFIVDQNGNLSGQQRSSITPLQGQQAELRTSAYNLEGKITLESNGMVADIHFTKTAGYGANVNGKFYVMPAGTTDHLWFISSGATLPASSNIPADETVSIEAVRMAAP
jgi:hypothetical protein